MNGGGFPYMIAVVILSGTKTPRLCKLNQFLTHATFIQANKFYLSFFVNWFQAVKLITPQAWTDLHYSGSGLAKLPDTDTQDFRYSYSSFNGNTEGWEW